MKRQKPIQISKKTSEIERYKVIGNTILEIKHHDINTLGESHQGGKCHQILHHNSDNIRLRDHIHGAHSV